MERNREHIPSAAKALYRNSIKHIPFVRNFVFWVKQRLRYLSGYYPKYKAPTWHTGSERDKPLKFAAICDKFTWTNIDREFDAVYLSVHNWRAQMEQHRPDVFFCEAAWEGKDGDWTNEIYRNHDFTHDNRPALKDILRYCREAGIPTVFWNKEDTPKFDDAPLSFIDTALLFDHIFTTCAECIPKYQARGHQSVHLMMFGYSPDLFFLCSPRPKNSMAVFLGSWYEANRERCEDTCRLFDTVLGQGLELRIYDRVSERQLPDRQFPERYRPYILPAVPYEQTTEIMNEADYVININSVKDSETMFARRVFEAMACGRIVISNDSLGLRKLFPGRIWFAGQPFDREREDEIIAKNLETVQSKYTFRAQLIAALDAAGIQIKQ